MGEELAHEGDVNLNREGHLIWCGGSDQLAREVPFFQFEVGGDLAGCQRNRFLDQLHFARFGAHGNDLARAHDVRAAVHFFAVDLNVAVGDELLSCENGGGDAKPEDEVVEAAFEVFKE